MEVAIVRAAPLLRPPGGQLRRGTLQFNGAREEALGSWPGAARALGTVTVAAAAASL